MSTVIKYVQEEIAKDLNLALTQGFTNSFPATELTIKGAGVNWNCEAKRNNNLCTIHCFDANGGEYLTHFERDSEMLAWARTSSKLDTINAVEDWLKGEELSALYLKYSFVDKTKRDLSSIQDDVVSRFPELAESSSIELRHVLSDIYELWFKSADRSCRISYYGKNKFPDAVFHWDECELFRFKADNDENLAKVLKRWLCDAAMPSTMREEFPWIQIGKLADYYEKGNPVEGEFIESWDSIERFYADMKYPILPQILNLIGKMRQKGYDKSLRAGQSLWTLILSRSRRHGLRIKQPCIAFQFLENGMDVYISLGEDKKIKFPKIEFNPEIDTLLKKLETMNID